jgi:hypothetical protein
MRIIPDSGQRIDVELYETDDQPPPVGASVRVFIEFPYIADIARDRITIHDAEGEHTLWERPREDQQVPGA